jgi:hypothetical protein
LLVACLSLVEFTGCSGDDSGVSFGERETNDAGKGSGGSSGGSAGSTSGGSSGTGGASGSAGSGEAGTSGAGGSDDDAGPGGTAGGDQDGSPDAGGAAGASGSAGGGIDAAPDAITCPQPTTYYRDVDSDGFGDPNVSIKACARPAGYSESDKDCYDQNADAKPGQTAWFIKHRGDGSYDYDCNGTGVRRWTSSGGCGLGFCMLIAGWQGTTIPNCGDNGAWISSCTSLAICQMETVRRDQECH